jgi:hypothetical protein
MLQGNNRSSFQLRLVYKPLEDAAEPSPDSTPQAYQVSAALLLQCELRLRQGVNVLMAPQRMPLKMMYTHQALVTTLEVLTIHRNHTIAWAYPTFEALCIVNVCCHCLNRYEIVANQQLLLHIQSFSFTPVSQA